MSATRGWAIDSPTVDTTHMNYDGPEGGMDPDEADPDELMPYVDPKSGRVGYASRNGATIDPRFEDASPFNDGNAVVKMDSLWGVIDEKGSFVLGPRYQRVFPPIDGRTIACPPAPGGPCVVELGKQVKCMTLQELWGPWREAIRTTSFPDKELVVRVLEMYPSQNGLMAELANMERTYEEMREVREAVTKKLLQKP